MGSCALEFESASSHLEHPEAITRYVTTYNAERKRLKKEANQERTRLDRRLGEIEREMKRAVDAITKGAPPEPLIPRMRELEAERTSLAGRLEAAKEADNVIALHPRKLSTATSAT